MFVWNMKLSFGERQPFRIWFDYLKICLNDESLSKKVDRDYYKSWNLSEIKNSKFDKLLKSAGSSVNSFPLRNNVLLITSEN